MGGLAGDTRLTVVNLHGQACGYPTVRNLYDRWTGGERNGLALAPDLVERAEAMLSIAGNREIARQLGISHTSVAKIRNGYPTWMRDGTWRVRKMRIRIMHPATMEFTIGHITGIEPLGPQEIVTVAAGGKQLSCGLHCSLATFDGEILASRVEEGSHLLANGVPLHQSPEWLRYQREHGVNIQQMADAAGVSYHTIRKWLRIHGLQFTPDDSKGRIPWNAGVTGYALSKRTYSAEGLARVKAARSGPSSNFWRGGVTSERHAIGAWTTARAPEVHARYDYTCQACGNRGGRLYAHHVIPVAMDPSRARDLDNLVSVCDRCHREIHWSEYEELAFASCIAGSPLPPRKSPIQRRARRCAHAVEATHRAVGSVEPVFDVEIDGGSAHVVANGLIVRSR